MKVYMEPNYQLFSLKKEERKHYKSIYYIPKAYHCEPNNNSMFDEKLRSKFINGFISEGFQIRGSIRTPRLPTYLAKFSTYTSHFLLKNSTSTSRNLFRQLEYDFLIDHKDFPNSHGNVEDCKVFSHFSEVNRDQIPVQHQEVSKQGHPQGKGTNNNIPK